MGKPYKKPTNVDKSTAKWAGLISLGYALAAAYFEYKGEKKEEWRRKHGGNN